MTLLFRVHECHLMSTTPLPPDPEQIIPPTPPAKKNILILAIGVVVALVVIVFILRAVMKPTGPTDSQMTTLPVLGDPKAPLTIFEYASFACEHCAHAQPMIKEVLSRYEGKVKLVYIHFIPVQQPTHERAAAAGVCAAEQGKFWPFAHLMFERQSSWVKDPNPDALWLLYASQAGMDTNLLAKCLDAPAAHQAVAQQLMMGSGQMVQRTPTFLIGEERIVSPTSVDEFIKVIDKELASLKKG